VNDKKPREFWIDPEPNPDEENTYFGDAFTEHPGQGPLNWQSSFVHVIEYSALEAAQKETAKIKADLAIAVEALENAEYEFCEAYGQGDYARMCDARKETQEALAKIKGDSCQ
jgi:hypothetical protein